jgi:hypothetical protein
MSLPLLPGRALLLAGMLVLALAACGRRGAPEAPLTSAELAAQQQSAQARQQRQAAAEDDDEVGNATIMTPVPTPTRRRSRAYTIPTEPFVLDPLL